MMMVAFQDADVQRITRPFVAAGWILTLSDSPVSGVRVSIRHSESGDTQVIHSPVGADAREMLRELANKIGISL